jgi:hypothetical protein
LTSGEVRSLRSHDAAQAAPDRPRLRARTGEQVIKEKLLEMAARFQALAEGDDDEQ